MCYVVKNGLCYVLSKTPYKAPLIDDLSSSLVSMNAGDNAHFREKNSPTSTIHVVNRGMSVSHI